MKRIAVTRALPEALSTAERLAERGVEAVVAPLLTIETVEFNADATGAQALLFTSGNGVRAFADKNDLRDIEVFAVGDATAAAAHAAGFADVRSADGDSTALAALVTHTLEPQNGKLIHFSGAQVAGDVIGALAAAGFIVERHIAYEAVAATALPDGFAAPLDMVLFHSARAAETFVHLGAPHASDMIAVCLSPAVAAAAGAVDWRGIIVSPAPREDALLSAALEGNSPPLAQALERPGDGA